MNLKEYCCDLAGSLGQCQEVCPKAPEGMLRQGHKTIRVCRGGTGIPANKTGEAQKFARPYHGPYGILKVTKNTAKIRRVDMPREEPILVTLGGA